MYQVNMSEAAEWMQQKDIQEVFMRHYDGISSIQNKLLYIIAEFVPTTFDAGSSYAHAKLEEDNMLTRTCNRILKIYQTATATNRKPKGCPCNHRLQPKRRCKLCNMKWNVYRR
jgi:hypothetical protein